MNLPSMVITAEQICCLVLLVAVIGLLTSSERRKSSVLLAATMLAEIFVSVADSVAYASKLVTAIPDVVVYAAFFISYSAGSLVIVLFSRYCNAYISERTPVRKWVFAVPAALGLASFLTAVASILSGNLFVVVGGTVQVLAGISPVYGYLNLIAMVYLPIAAFAYRKKIGVRPVFFLGFYFILPVIGYFIVPATEADLTFVMGGISLMIVYVLLQNNVSQEREQHQRELESLNGELEERQAQLEEAAAEQEAQIEEITALNGELEERQAQLEKTSAVLSDALERSRTFGDTISGIHEAMGSAHWSVLFDEEGKEQKTVFSDEMRRLLGYEEDELPSSMIAFTSLVHPDDLQVTAAKTQAFFAGQADSGRLTLLYRLMTKCGGYRWFNANSVIMRREDGAPDAVYGVIMDVNDLEQARRGLADAIDATNAIHDSLGSGDWRVELAPDGTVASVDWSDRFRAMLGYADQADFPNRLESWTNLIHPEDKEGVVSSYRRTLADRAGKSAYDATYRLLCRDGQYRYFRSVGKPTREDDGTPKVFYGMFVDVTDRETYRMELEALNGELEERQAQLEESAAEQEAQIEEITALNDELTDSRDRLTRNYSVISSLSQFFSALYYVDLATYESKNALILEIDSVERIAGVVGDARDTFGAIAEGTVEESSRRDFAEFTDVTTLAYRLQEKRAITMQFLGSTIGWFEGAFIAAERDESGRCTHVIWTVRSIHEQKMGDLAIQNELEAARAEAEAANAAKSSFLFNMSHDIRTPMNAIIGFADLMERYDSDAERRHDYLHKIKDSSTVLLGIINNVLDMARIESGAAEVSETAWSAEQFNDTLYSVFEEMMDAKGIEFTREIRVEHPYVLCDATKMGQIFNNILSNACKYTNPGGKVSMLLEELPCDREGYACFRTTISDTGIGMSAEYLPPYSRSSRASAPPPTAISRAPAWACPS